MNQKVEFKPFDELDKKCKMSIGEFRGGVTYNCYNEHDGHGYYANMNEKSNVLIDFNDILNGKQPDWATHVIWYNK